MSDCNKSIPTYMADGTRVRNHSLAAVEHLLEQDRVTVERKRNGTISRAYFRPTDQQQNPLNGNPIIKRFRRGAVYSSMTTIGEVRLWQLHKLPASRDAFRAVERSVLQKECAPIVSIDAFRESAKNVKRNDGHSRRRSAA
jgi:hypothetical protein